MEIEIRIKDITIIKDLFSMVISNTSMTNKEINDLNTQRNELEKKKENKIPLTKEEKKDLKRITTKFESAFEEIIILIDENEVYLNLMDLNRVILISIELSNIEVEIKDSDLKKHCFLLSLDEIRKIYKLISNISDSTTIITLKEYSMQIGMPSFKFKIIYSNEDYIFYQNLKQLRFDSTIKLEGFQLKELLNNTLDLSSIIKIDSINSEDYVFGITEQAYSKELASTIREESPYKAYALFINNVYFPKNKIKNDAWDEIEEISFFASKKYIKNLLPLFNKGEIQIIIELKKDHPLKITIINEYYKVFIYLAPMDIEDETQSWKSNSKINLLNFM